MKPHLLAGVSLLIIACSCVSDANAHVAAVAESSSFARYYVERLSTGPDALTIEAHSPWAWAMVRGADGRRQPLANIAFDGSSDVVRLEVPANEAGNAYEIILSRSPLHADDPALLPGRQSPINGVSVTLGHLGYEKMERDPPPPPPENWDFTWEFEPPVGF